MGLLFEISHYSIFFSIYMCVYVLRASRPLADFDGAKDVEVRSLSPLGFLLRKEASIRRVSARDHDLACLHSVGR